MPILGQEIESKKHRIGAYFGVDKNYYSLSHPNDDITCERKLSYFAGFEYKYLLLNKLFFKTILEYSKNEFTVYYNFIAEDYAYQLPGFPISSTYLSHFLVIAPGISYKLFSLGKLSIIPGFGFTFQYLFHQNAMLLDPYDEEIHWYKQSTNDFFPGIYFENSFDYLFNNGFGVGITVKYSYFFEEFIKKDLFYSDQNFQKVSVSAGIGYFF